MILPLLGTSPRSLLLLGTRRDRLRLVAPLLRQAPRFLLGSSRRLGAARLVVSRATCASRDFPPPVGLNTVLAGFHYDLNFLTVHGKSRFPGLKVWTRAGHVVVPKIPPGHLFLQAGKQFEYLTGGHVLAGFHDLYELLKQDIGGG